MCGDGLFFEIPSLANDTLLTTLQPILEILLQTVDRFVASKLHFRDCKSPEILWDYI